MQDYQDLSGGLFEDEDTRVFYEDLPNLQDLVPEVSTPCQRLLKSPKCCDLVLSYPSIWYFGCRHGQTSLRK